VPPRLSVVQPSNILIGADGQVKLSDFGIMKEEQDGTYHSVCSTFKGTVRRVIHTHCLASPLRDVDFPCN